MLLPGAKFFKCNDTPLLLLLLLPTPPPKFICNDGDGGGDDGWDDDDGDILDVELVIVFKIAPLLPPT